jgi:hypothetical protein
MVLDTWDQVMPSWLTNPLTFVSIHVYFYIAADRIVTRNGHPSRRRRPILTPRHSRVAQGPAG